jgi:hypothetical protein
VKQELMTSLKGCEPRKVLELQANAALGGTFSRDIL